MLRGVHEVRLSACAALCDTLCAGNQDLRLTMPQCDADLLDAWRSGLRGVRCGSLRHRLTSLPAGVGRRWSMRCGWDAAHASVSARARLLRGLRVAGNRIQESRRASFALLRRILAVSFATAFCTLSTARLVTDSTVLSGFSDGREVQGPPR